MQVFKNIALQQAFEKNGYVVVDAVDINTVRTLHELYKNIQPESFPGFSSTIFNPDIALKQDTSRRITDILQPFINHHIEHYRSLGCSFLCKTPGQDSVMPVHNDWTIVEEPEYFSATIWMPLTDTNQDNGALWVLPGSHRFSDALRGPSMPYVFKGLDDMLLPQMEPLYIKAGQAVIFNHALLHASPPNLSPSERIVVTFGFVPKDAKLIFNHLNENGKVEVYHVNDDFFLTYNHIGHRPETGILSAEVDSNWKSCTSSDVNTMLRAIRNQNKYEQMKRLFKDESVQDFYNKNGYTLIPMLNEEQVKQLLDLYYEMNLTDNNGSGFSMSIEDTDKAKVRAIRDRIYEISLPSAMEHFHEAKAIAGSYVVKHPNPGGVVPPHQDWSFVENEGENYSVTCWIALVDTKLENGCMGVISGTHHLVGNLRPSPSPQVPTPLGGNVFSIFPYLEMKEMKAGDALIFDHRTFHGSTPNITNELRIAVGIGFTQKDSKLCHYHLKPNGQNDTLIKYYIDEDFSINYNNFQLSQMFDKGESIDKYEYAGEIPYVCPRYSLEEVKQLFEQNGNKYDESLHQRIQQLFQAQNQNQEQTQQNNGSPFIKLGMGLIHKLKSLLSR
jgi:ectoine hydroxylase-related dioxygenase (phytanoyl-CoA dioxygenase family)